MHFVIATYGTADGKHVRTEDPRRYATRDEAEEVIADRVEIGDVAAREGRMKVEEIE